MPDMQLGNAVGSPVLQAITPVAGFPLQNATPVLFTWKVPADGQQHRFQVTASQLVTVAETGGEVDLAFTTPDGTAVSGVPLFAGGAAPGVSAAFFSRLVKAGSTVTVQQTAALTAGTASVYAELWGSL